ncbi:GTP-binding protein [Isoptericola sp. NPDC019482]|uniref:CobW family GTP-binding protein n=1 Tax=Isoptericola sp. NPDC019482 TaxID=3154688 RepID=UPI0034859FC3
MGTPVTVLGGYLGAGKTTLLNGLLDTADGRRIGVVVNDFGTVNVDRRLVRSATADTIELADGCVCCSLRGEVGEVMRRLAARDDLDHVVVEASGIADPTGLSTWGAFPGLAPGGTVVCADVTTVGRKARDRYVGDVVRTQLSRADVLVLTRCDLATPEAVAAAESVAHRHAPGARLLRSRGGDVRAADLLGGAPTVETPATGPVPTGPTPPGDGHGHVTRFVPLAGPVDTTALAGTLRSLPSAVVRAKGVVRTTAGGSVVVQAAAGQVEIASRGPDDGADDAHDPPGVVLVAAGRGAAEALAAAACRLTGLLGARGRDDVSAA